jgi:pyruvate ferredoxin oxidoreductase gamma subunit/phenylglyoxylate dehydrogenase gamma subunit
MLPARTAGFHTTTGWYGIVTPACQARVDLAEIGEGESMTEIRFHGRGGQGAVLAASILAQALAEEGKYVVAVPAFGFERRGAPVTCFVKVGDTPIRAMTNIYHPDILLCIDPTVSMVVNIFQGMNRDGTLVQAARQPANWVSLSPDVAKVGSCDAVKIAMGIFNRPITNTVMLGAFARTTGLVSLDALQVAIEAQEFRDAGLKQNIDAVHRGFEETTIQHRGEPT